MTDRQDRDDATATWLIEGLEESNGSPGRKPARSRKAGTKSKSKGKARGRGWLAVPDPKSSEDLELVQDADDEDGAEGEDGGRGAGRPRSRGRLVESARERRLSSKLRRARDRLLVQADQIAGLRRHVAQLETALEDQRSRLAEVEQELTKARGRSGRQPPAKGRTGSSGRPKRRASFNANTASFEELRELGLSVTQSARVIGYRETSGGFESESDLKQLKRLPKETISTLIEAGLPAKASTSRSALKPNPRAAVKKAGGSRRGSATKKGSGTRKSTGGSKPTRAKKR